MGMPSPPRVPQQLRGIVFSRAHAHANGVTDAMLRGREYVCVRRGVYRTADTPLSFESGVRAALHVLPADAALSHVTNLRWRGLSIGPPEPLHLALCRDLRRRPDGIVLHRYQHSIDVEYVDAVPVLRPARTFIDCATILSVRRLVWVGDWLVARGLVDMRTLRTEVYESHLDGVQRARRAAAMVRPGAESVRESDTRWLLVTAGLPEPPINRDLYAASGRFLGRGDLSYPEFRVLVEYDGWYHERTAAQRGHDVLRREGFEAAGWRVVVVTAGDLAEFGRVAWRVFDALRERGYTGPRPTVGPRFGRL